MYDIVSQYLEYLEVEKGLSNNTIDAYRRDLYDFISTIELEDIFKIDRLSINSYIRILKERKLAPTTIIRRVASLRGFFKWTTSMNILSKNLQSALLDLKKKNQKLEADIEKERELENMRKGYAV